MDRWLIHTARVVGATIGTFAGIIAVQLLRLRRMTFLPLHPGFYVNHLVPAHDVAAPGTPLRLVVFGDSTTAGVGVDQAEESLPYHLAVRIAAHHGRAVHVVSYGWAGARVTDLARTQVPRALEPLRSHETSPFLPGADIVAVVIGANDATHRTPPRRYRADLRHALGTIRATAPEARVVLAGIPAFRGALRSIEPLMFITDTYARLLRPISRQEAVRCGAAFADLARDVPPRIDRSQPFLATDHFHPSAVGYRIWGDVIFEALIAGPESASLPVGAPFEAAGA